MLVASGAQWAQVGALDGAAAAGLWSSAKADVSQASTAQTGAQLNTVATPVTSSSDSCPGLEGFLKACSDKTIRGSVVRGEARQ